jgi:hypothetical protein
MGRTTKNKAVKSPKNGHVESSHTMVMSWEAGLWGTITQNKPNMLPVPAISSRGYEVSQVVAQVSAGDKTL